MPSYMVLIVIAFLSAVGVAGENPYPRFSPAWWSWEAECNPDYSVFSSRLMGIAHGDGGEYSVSDSDDHVGGLQVREVPFSNSLDKPAKQLLS
ncbi:hypothetical protein FOL47_000091 [Perkinsus chesapeaki]|uniref:Alpha-carbonic anhydrase domain-containing protein n=1 Tax=Perkinsus chesapeaki TaxID=330153 RepID=A0A7J6N638_PERCH|nr:hypothetical protein FOL47_000091 [Perkinsus chesapeaki]